MTKQNGSRSLAMINHASAEPVGADCGAGTIQMRSQPGPQKHINEDCAAVFEVSNTRCVLAIADGVGGAPRGHDASRLAMEALSECLRDLEADEPLGPRITDAFELAHQRIMMLGIGAATTFIVAEIDQQTLRTYHTGDSGSLVCGQRGKLKHKTLMHCPSAYLELAGEITEQESLTHPQRHLVTNLLGIDDMTIDISRSIKLAPLDTVLLASDGVLDNANTADLINLIRIGPLPKVSQSLHLTMLQTMAGTHPPLPGKPDDLSFILYRSTKK